MGSDQPYYFVGPSAYAPRYSQTGCEFIEQYSQSTGYSKPAPMNPHSQSVRPLRSGRDYNPAHSVFPQQGAASRPMYGSLAAAAAPHVLPPIRNNVQLPPVDSAIPQYRRNDIMIRPEPQHPRKEEKSTGGVAAHLDYEMDQMSDFVAEMAQGMYDLYITRINLADIDLARSVCPGVSVTPQFRKYVFQILSSTRLPSSTILLGLYYLASRMRMLSSTSVYAAGSGQIYRMLTVALVLGSKFLDDNTFQNKSWAEVSNIAVTELNAMELDWLFAFDWKIHRRIHDEQDGFASWRVHWETWRAKTALKARDSRQSLAPINLNATRTQPVSKPLMSPEGPIPLQYQRSSNFENSWLNPAASEYSPPSAPQSGPTTPDYYPLNPWAYGNPTPPYYRSWIPHQQPYVPRTASRPQLPPYHQTPSYALPFSQNMWSGHGSPCGCMLCTKHLYMCGNTLDAMQPVIAA